MAEPAELTQDDVKNLRILSSEIKDGVTNDTTDPHEVIMRFAMDRDIPIGTILLQMAQRILGLEEDCEDLSKILRDYERQC